MSPKTISQQKRQFTIAVMDVPSLSLTDINEGVDYNTKSGQRFVNHARLFKTLAFSMSMLGALTSCQVDDMELGTFHLPYT